MQWGRRVREQAGRQSQGAALRRAQGQRAWGCGFKYLAKFGSKLPGHPLSVIGWRGRARHGCASLRVRAGVSFVTSGASIAISCKTKLRVVVGSLATLAYARSGTQT